MAVDVGVEAQPVAHSAAEKGVQRDAQMLAQDVPQRLFQTTQRRVPDATPGLLAQAVADAGDLQGIPPHQALGKDAQGCHAEGVIRVMAGLADARDACIRMHPHEQPVPTVVHLQDQGFDGCDLHGE